MKERPILFSSLMVQAILDGRKTMTRRRVKHQAICNALMQNGGVVKLYHPSKIDRHGELYPGPDRFGISNEDYSIACPYGHPGDRLWVKETFRYYSSGKVCYKADNKDKMPGWKPSIFMPRSASRILLEITSVRVERLQDITEEDAIKEGTPHTCHWNAIGNFSMLWESINGPGSWYNNPWVWVIEFKKLEL